MSYIIEKIYNNKSRGQHHCIGGSCLVSLDSKIQAPLETSGKITVDIFPSDWVGVEGGLRIFFSVCIIS